ncbi:MAG TPA: tetratricopeptide repeat protein, partial [Luteibaculaceae bacterium]|nr:tetratricopeptide repeat protein [Luteibaculaceae bacterium]
MTATRILLLLSMVWFQMVAKAQKFAPEDLPTWKLKNLVTGYERIGDLYSAIDMAEEFVVRRPKNTDMQRKLALLYVQTRDYTSALEILEKIQSNFSQDAEIQFLYAQMLKQNGFYERSTDAFDSFLN